MKYGLLFCFLGALLAFDAVVSSGWSLLLLWPALRLSLVGVSYLGLGPVLSEKREKGTLTPISIVVLLP